MSKWVTKDLFQNFVEEKKNETQPATGGAFIDKKWKNLEKGPSDNPKTYEVRFLPDPVKGFYKKIFYHMWKVGEKWCFYQCPKTEDFNNPCPICAVVNKLFQGSESDKVEARKLKRKEKYVSNVFVAYDPRDAGKAADDESKQEGKVLLYEFPSKLEQKLAEEIKDTRNGLGASVFDPGPDGYNFIIKVGTQSGGQNQSFPEYSMSTFARRPSAIGSDEEIDKLMETRVSLDEYITKGKKSMNDLIKSMKDEMFWDLIARDFERYETVTEKKTEEPKKEESKSREESKKEDVKTEPKREETKKEENSELSEEDLLAELENF